MIQAASSIETIGICGLGQMGAAASVAFKRAGYQVLAWDSDSATVSALAQKAQQLEAWLDDHGKPPLASGGNIAPHLAPDTLDQRSDVIMDCISEDLDQKITLFKQFSGCIERGSLFITCTSGLSITEIGRGSGCGQMLVGTHFWNPPHLMPLVEVIRGADTSDDVIDAVCQLIESIGKWPVRVNQDVPGFIGNRLLHALWREAISLVEKGIATPEDIDLVARLTFGLRLPVLGPLENMDLVGLDLIERIHGYLLEDIADNHQPSKYLSLMVSQGILGHKSGAGFYDWKERSIGELVERRDRQILRQLAYLDELDSLYRQE